MRRDSALIAIQEQLKKLTMELERVKGFECWAPHHREFDVNPIDIAYISSYDGHEDRGVRERGPFRDDLSGLKIEAWEFDDSLKPENYIYWVQPIKRIVELKEYNDEKAFMLAILKLKEYASLWYETLKKSWERENKYKIKTWSNLKKQMARRFLPPSYKQELYLKITSLS